VQIIISCSIYWLKPRGEIQDEVFAQRYFQPTKLKPKQQQQQQLDKKKVYV